jgi:hypothetical protein
MTESLKIYSRSIIVDSTHKHLTGEKKKIRMKWAKKGEK